MRKMKWILCLIFIPIVPVLISAQLDPNDYAEELLHRLIPNFVGIRNLGMGGTGVAGTRGSAALFTNPSLLATMEDMSIMGGLRLKFGLIENEYQDDLAKLNDVKYKTGLTPPYVSLNHLSFGIPFRIEVPNVPITVAAGIGYHPSYNTGLNKFTEAKTNLYKTETKEKFRGGIRNLSPGFALGIKDMFFIGFGLNIHNINNYKGTVEIETKSTTGSTKEEYIYEARGRAFFVTFGAAIKPIPNLSIGMRVSPGFEWELSDFEYEYKVDGETIDEQESDDEIEITVPALFCIGVEYQIIPQFALATEYQTRAFTQAEIDGDECPYDNGFAFRFGSEIMAGPVPIRLGFLLESVPSSYLNFTKLTGNIEDDKPITAIGVTGGIGIPIQEIALIDFGFLWGFYKREEKRTSVTGSGTKTYDYKENQFSFDLGLTFNIPGPKFGTAPSTTTTTIIAPPLGTPVRQPVPTTQPIQTTPAPQPVPLTEPIETAPLTEPVETTPLTEPVETAPLTEPDEETTPEETTPEETWEQQTPEIGTHVYITTDTGQEFRGKLLEDNPSAYVIDIEGNRITVYKNIVNTIEAQ